MLRTGSDASKHWHVITVRSNVQNFRESFQNSLSRNNTRNSCSAVRANTGEHTFAQAMHTHKHTPFSALFIIVDIVNKFFFYFAAISSLLVIQFTKTTGIFKVEHPLTFPSKHERTSWINEHTVNVNMTIFDHSGFFSCMTRDLKALKINIFNQIMQNVIPGTHYQLKLNLIPMQNCFPSMIWQQSVSALKQTYQSTQRE